MTDTINETYMLTIKRTGTEFEVIDFKTPEDAFGKKMLSIMLYNIAERLDPAFAEARQDSGQ